MLLTPQWMPTNSNKNTIESIAGGNNTSGFAQEQSNAMGYSIGGVNQSMTSFNGSSSQVSGYNPSSLHNSTNNDATFYSHNNTNASLDNALLNAGGLLSPPHKSSSSVSFISPLGAMAALNSTTSAGGAAQQAPAFMPNKEAWGGASILTESARRHANMVARINNSRYTGEVSIGSRPPMAVICWALPPRTSLPRPSPPPYS